MTLRRPSRPHSVFCLLTSSLFFMCLAGTGTSATDAILAKWQPLRMPYR